MRVLRLRSTDWKSSLNEHDDPHFLFYKLNENNILNYWEKYWQKSMATFLANEINATDSDVTGPTEQCQIMFPLKDKILIMNARYLKPFLSYFFVKKYLLVGASSMLLTGRWMSQWVSESVSERSMYVTPIRSDLL